MEKVIFICLLSISMSLSLPNQEQAPGPQPTTALPLTVTEKPLNASGQAQVPPPHSEIATETTNNTVKKDENATQTASSNATQSGKAEATTVVVPVTPKNETMEVPSTEKAKPAAPIVPTTVASTVKPDDKGEKKKEPSSTVVDTSPTLQSRAFDGPSFIGGIILTLGLLAVSFMGFKYYKKQHAENYHTL